MEWLRRTVRLSQAYVLTGATAATEQLPDELEHVIAQLVHVDDAALWQAAWSHMPTDAAERLEALNLKRQREGLDEAEREAIVGAILRGLMGLTVVHAGLTVDEIASVAQGTAPRLAVVDMGAGGAERAERLPIIALLAGATMHQSRSFDLASLTQSIWDVAVQSHRGTM